MGSDVTTKYSDKDLGRFKKLILTKIEKSLSIRDALLLEAITNASEASLF